MFAEQYVDVCLQYKRSSHYQWITHQVFIVTHLFLLRWRGGSDASYVLPPEDPHHRVADPRAAPATPAVGQLINHTAQHRVHHQTPAASIFVILQRHFAYW